MAQKTAHSPPPDGIGTEHIDLRPLQQRPGILSLVILGALVVFGLSGYAGGGSAEHEVRNAAGTFELRSPDIIRNGDMLETRMHVVAQRPIDKLVIGVEPALWREVTTNSTVPQAAEETFRDGLFRFSFHRIEAGAAFEFQVAQQINPGLWGTNRGRVVFLDGDTVLAELPVALRVLP
jgi:hypothetical protein